jgi:hypothetical protein
MSGVTTHLGSGGDFAVIGTVIELTTDAIFVEVDAGVTEGAGGVLGPGEKKLFVIGGEHCMFAFGT